MSLPIFRNAKYCIYSVSVIIERFPEVLYGLMEAAVGFCIEGTRFLQRAINDTRKRKKTRKILRAIHRRE